MQFNFREKLLAKLKVSPGPAMAPSVETDDKLWIFLKK